MVNTLYEPFQSGFCTQHSTETALLHVINDHLMSANSDSLNILLLDLSAAFDTVNHDMLISYWSSIGIADIALQWFRLYLPNRQQFNHTRLTQVLHLPYYMWCPSEICSWVHWLFDTPWSDYSKPWPYAYALLCIRHSAIYLSTYTPPV